MSLPVRNLLICVRKIWSISLFIWSAHTCRHGHRNPAITKDSSYCFFLRGSLCYVYILSFNESLMLQLWAILFIMWSSESRLLSCCHQGVAHRTWSVESSLVFILSSAAVKSSTDSHRDNIQEVVVKSSCNIVGISSNSWAWQTFVKRYICENCKVYTIKLEVISELYFFCLAFKVCDCSLSSCFSLLWWEGESCWSGIRSCRLLAVEVSSSGEGLSCTFSPETKWKETEVNLPQMRTHTTVLTSATKQSFHRP